MIFTQWISLRDWKSTYWSLAEHPYTSLGMVRETVFGHFAVRDMYVTDVQMQDGSGI